MSRLAKLAPILLASVPAVDMNTASAQPLYTVPSGLSAIITGFVIRNASTSLTTVSFSIGWTAAAYNDVLATATHTEINSATVYTVLVPKTGAKVGVAGAILQLIDNILQGGAATATIEVFGYLF